MIQKSHRARLIAMCVVYEQNWVRLADISRRFEALGIDYCLTDRSQLKRIFFYNLTRDPLQYLIRSHFAFHL